MLLIILTKKIEQTQEKLATQDDLIQKLQEQLKEEKDAVVQYGNILDSKFEQIKTLQEKLDNLTFQVDKYKIEARESRIHLDETTQPKSIDTSDGHMEYSVSTANKYTILTGAENSIPVRSVQVTQENIQNKPIPAPRRKNRRTVQHETDTPGDNGQRMQAKVNINQAKGKKKALLLGDSLTKGIIPKYLSKDYYVVKKTVYTIAEAHKVAEEIS